MNSGNFKRGCKSTLLKVSARLLGYGTNSGGPKGMNLEERRIPTKFALPYMPVRGVLFVRLPKYLKSDRVVACISGWALNCLGVSADTLASTQDPLEALKIHGVNPSGLEFLKDAAKLHDDKKVQKAFTTIRDGLSRNQSTLANAFGPEKVTALIAKVNEVLAMYSAGPRPTASKSNFQRF